MSLTKQAADTWTVRQLYDAGYKKLALWLVCPYGTRNPRHMLGTVKWPKGCLKNLKLM